MHYEAKRTDEIQCSLARFTLTPGMAPPRMATGCLKTTNGFA